jgi:hypothetical protein
MFFNKYRGLLLLFFINNGKSYRVKFSMTILIPQNYKQSTRLTIHLIIREKSIRYNFPKFLFYGKKK